MVVLRGISVFLIVCVLGFACGKSATSRSLGRVHIPWLGIGPTCTGCPQHFCDDDPAIIHGFCCGCARAYDDLPVKCSLFLDCPGNTYALCEEYEYMMHCCCA